MSHACVSEWRKANAVPLLRLQIGTTFLFDRSFDITFCGLLTWRLWWSRIFCLASCSRVRHVCAGVWVRRHRLAPGPCWDAVRSTSRTSVEVQLGVFQACRTGLIHPECRFGVADKFTDGLLFCFLVRSSSWCSERCCAIRINFEALLQRILLFSWSSKQI